MGVPSHLRIADAAPKGSQRPYAPRGVLRTRQIGLSLKPSPLCNSGVSPPECAAGVTYPVTYPCYIPPGVVHARARVTYPVTYPRSLASQLGLARPGHMHRWTFSLCPPVSQLPRYIGCYIPPSARWRGEGVTYLVTYPCYIPLPLGALHTPLRTCYIPLCGWEVWACTDIPIYLLLSYFLKM